jgi:N-acetylmuramoyl-L-alanine amidase
MDYIQEKCYYFKMKNIVFGLLFVLVFPVSSSEGLFYMKLRASQHPEFLRIVLEGDESIISGGMVNQKGKDIIVKFPYANIILQEKKAPISYKIDKGIITLHPGSFRSFKVFSLKYPSRLVIDVYLEPEKKYVKRSLEALRQKLRRKIKPSVKAEQPKKVFQRQETKVYVIDPGHGGFESGIVWEKYQEKTLVLDIAKRLSSLINRGANKSYLTRESDQFMTLGERYKFANTKKSEIFLSLHIGNHHDIILFTPVIIDIVPGEMEDYFVNKGQEKYLKQTAALRDTLIKAIANDFGDNMASTKALPYSILSEIEAAALIIELPSFEDTSYSANLKTKIANTLYKGLYLYEETTEN